MKAYFMISDGHAMRKIIILTVYLVSVAFTVYFVQADERGDSSMVQTTGTKTMLPAIDTPVPVKTDTATFALG